MTLPRATIVVVTYNSAQVLEDCLASIERHAAGASVIADLVRQAAGRASIMPGGGVTEENLAQIVQATGVCEIHLSARNAVPSGMEFRNSNCSMGVFSKEHEYERREASAENIRLAKKALVASLGHR